MPISTALVPVPPRAPSRVPAPSRATIGSTPIGSARAAQGSPRFQFSETARDALQVERWHREWAEARSSLVTGAYTALERPRAGTLFDLAA
ncbi:hypothetical protein HT136_04775 [Novosphingobium profundi]|uniref:hypothetical protein n=1 Tax=Novosphingobium profundi TaxID=1774954 RepID=UPI001BDA1EA2|nr:hypothetical protein [Novosphingobium profundi]MBT0667676.1 hypothetical protein [Novosphingobium profundi]